MDVLTNVQSNASALLSITLPGRVKLLPDKRPTGIPPDVQLAPLNTHPAGSDDSVMTTSVPKALTVNGCTPPTPV
jgi:hypothetical protein